MRLGRAHAHPCITNHHDRPCQPPRLRTGGPRLATVLRAVAEPSSDGPAVRCRGGLGERCASAQRTRRRTPQPALVAGEVEPACRTDRRRVRIAAPGEYAFHPGSGMRVRFASVRQPMLGVHWNGEAPK